MEYKITRNTLFSISVFISLSYLATSSNITAIFGFGDLPHDTGNNNYIPTTTRADHPPYGRDFPDSVPTGRFSNGKLSIDMITSSLGIKELLPPYLDPKITDSELQTGAAFGSAASGLDPLTAQARNVISVSDQIKLFDQALKRLKNSLGEETTTFIVENALFFLSNGEADFVNYYIDRQRADEFDISGYQDFLIQIYEDFIQNLYSRGARRLVVNSLPPIGCRPLLITTSNITNPRRCVEEQNIESMAFNEKLQQLVTRMESQLQGSKIAYFDLYTPMIDMIANPANYGYEHEHEGCCGTGFFEIESTCTSAPACPDASKYIYFDSENPTEAAYLIFVDICLKNVIPYFTT